MQVEGEEWNVMNCFVFLFVILLAAVHIGSWGFS